MLSRAREKGYPWLLAVKESFRSFSRNNDFQAAASLSFYSLIAFIPLILLWVYPLGFFLLSSPSTSQGLERLFPDQFQGVNDFLQREAQTIARHRALWEILTVLTLLGLTLPFAKACRTQFSLIFKFERPWSFFRTKLWDILGSLVILSAFSLWVGGEFLYSLYVKTFRMDLPLSLDLGYLLGPFLSSLLVLFIFYLFFTPVKVRGSILLVGSLATVFLWSLIRPAFFLFLGLAPHYGFAFGSLKAFFLLFVWIYYSFAALLAGAELMANLKRREALLFKDLFFNPKAGRRIPMRYIRTLKKGEDVFKEGERGQEMYVILSGAVTIRKEDKPIRILKEKAFFGEMAMLLDRPRTATATAWESPTRLVCISRDNFEILLRENPQLVLTLLREMAHRLQSIGADSTETLLA
jgi:YihY family inner membrane protein